MIKNLFKITPKNLSKILLLILFVFIFNHCDNSKNKPQTQILKDTNNDSVQQLIPADPFPLIKYYLDTIQTSQELLEIIRKYRQVKGNFPAYKAFTTLNRKELRFVRVGQAVVIPDTIIADMRAYSVFPFYYPGAKNIKKIIMISTRYQSYGCYEFGKLVRFAAVNSGKERTPSYPGRYAITWKERNHLSSIDSNWYMPYTINFHRNAGSAFHKFTMPGYPASHSCVRQFIDDSEWLYYWVETEKYDSDRKAIPFSGTPVVIIDYYDFNPGKGYGWKYLKNNKEDINYLPKDPMSVDEAIIPICQIPLMARGSLRNYKRFLYAEDTLRARGVIRPGVRLTHTRNFNKERREREKKERERLQKHLQDSIKNVKIYQNPIKSFKKIDTSGHNSNIPDTLTIIR